LTTGRTGSDYLQCCLDNVPGIITLSGKTYFKNFFKKSSFENIKNSKTKVIDEFIKQYENLFVADEIENKKVNLSREKFKEEFLNEVKNFELNKKNFILSIFSTYEKITRNKIDEAKICVNHSHSIIETLYFLELFPESKLLVTVRDPLSNLMSGIENWKKYTNGATGQSHNYRYTRRILIDLKFAKNLKVKKHYVKLEDSFTLNEKQKLLNFLGVKYSENVNYATYNGKFWIGDKLSTSRTIDGTFNKQVLNKPIKNFYTNKDIICLKYFYKDYSQFNYIKKKFNFMDKLIFLFLSIFPLSYEKKEIFSKPLEFKNYYFYIKRVILFLSKI